MSRKHHHIVSEGYQRFFATPEGVRLVDKDALTAKVIGTKSAFAQKHFSSYLRDGVWCDELEDGWSKNENVVLPHVRRLVFNGDRDATGREALKVLAALHYARSYQARVLIERIILAEGETQPERLAKKDSIIRAFEHEFQRAPEPGEIERLVKERWTEHFGDRTFIVQQMARGFEKTIEILAPLHVQLVWPRRSGRIEFVFADNPLVHSDQGGRVTALSGLALGDASQIFLPVAPRLAALFTSKRVGDGKISDDEVARLNRRSWQGSIRFLGAHPDTNVKRSLGKWDLRVP